MEKYHYKNSECPSFHMNFKYCFSKMYIQNLVMQYHFSTNKYLIFHQNILNFIKTSLNQNLNALFL